MNKVNNEFNEQIDDVFCNSILNALEYNGVRDEALLTKVKYGLASIYKDNERMYNIINKKIIDRETYMGIAKELNLSYTRVNQIFNAGLRKVSVAIRSECFSDINPSSDITKIYADKHIMRMLRNIHYRSSPTINTVQELYSFIEVNGLKWYKSIRDIGPIGAKDIEDLVSKIINN